MDTTSYSRAAGGLRERNKREKLERIKTAARALFAQKGFDATTTREISERARVAAGTLFLYFKDKQELLVHLFLEDMQQQVDEAFATLPGEEAGLVERLLHVFSRLFAYYARDPELARVFVKELPFVNAGGRPELDVLNQGFLARLAGLLISAVARGEVRADVDLAIAPLSFFAVYYAALLAWLGGTVSTPEAACGLLRQCLELQLAGLHR